MIQCPVCHNSTFSQKEVLKNRLIEEWELTSNEVAYIDKQQGFCCDKCSCNLRSMTLALGIIKHYAFGGSFKQFVNSKYSRTLNLLEVNEAGSLHELLNNFRNYVFAEYPAVDMQNLPYTDDTFDLIIHSDTLEHVEHSDNALKECYRVLKKGGGLIYTIPIIYQRMTKKRDFLPNSYHGRQDELQGEDYKVWTEYGADFWVEIINSGFNKISLITLDDLSSLAICAVKEKKEILNKGIIYKGYLILKKIKRRIEQVLN